LPFLEVLREEWREHPPAHWLIAGYVRYEPTVRMGEGSDAEMALRGSMPMVENAPQVDTTLWDQYIDDRQEG